MHGRNRKHSCCTSKRASQSAAVELCPVAMQMLRSTFEAQSQPHWRAAGTEPDSELPYSPCCPQGAEFAALRVGGLELEILRVVLCLPAHHSTPQGWAVLLTVLGWRCWGKEAAQAGSMGREAANVGFPHAAPTGVALLLQGRCGVEEPCGS